MEILEAAEAAESVAAEEAAAMGDAAKATKSMEAGRQAETGDTGGTRRGIRRRLRPLRALRLALLCAALCAAVGIAGFLAGRFGGGGVGEAAELDAVVLENRLAEISELASVSWSYTNMAQYENSNVFYGVTLPFTTKEFILTYDGEIKAGVDLRKAEVEVSGRSVRVRLPEAEILSHEIDEKSVKVFSEKTSVFNPFTPEDFTAFQADQKAAMEKKALERGVLKEGRERAADSVSLLLRAALPQGYTLQIE